MCRHPVVLDVWFFIGPFVYFHTLCVRTAKALARLRGCAGSPEPSLVAYAIITITSWAGSTDLYQISGRSLFRFTFPMGWSCYRDFYDKNIKLWCVTLFRKLFSSSSYLYCFSFWCRLAALISFTKTKMAAKMAMLSKTIRVTTVAMAIVKSELSDAQISSVVAGSVSRIWATSRENMSLGLATR